MAAHRSAPFIVSLGRSRGREQLRRRPRRERHAVAAVPAAPRRRVPGVLRAHAAQDAVDPERAPYAHLPAARFRKPDRSEPARYAAVALRSGVQRRPAELSRVAGRGANHARAEQEKWVFGNLADARARWTVLSQQVYSFARDFVKQSPDARFGMDVWDGYPAARHRLYSRIKETKAANPIVLSGDVHVHYGADLKLDFADPKAEVDRHRVHEHVDFGRRRRRRGVRQLGIAARRQPAHPLSQRPSRLHRLHRDAGDDARRFQDFGPGDGAGRAHQDRRVAGR